MHDDHFLIIESSQSWVDGFDYNNWLPTSEGNKGPTGHSFFYIGLHYFLFTFLESIGINSAEIKMYVVRFLHAGFSLLIPYFTYKIAIQFSNKKNAGIAALLITILWPLPMFSVRNLVEMVCIPPVMAGIYLLVKKEEVNYKTLIIAGLVMGLAVGIRIQSILFIGGVGLAFWINKEFWKGIVYGLCALLTIFLSQISDVFIWGYPFAEFGEYISYNLNSENIQGYFVEPWYKFILVVLGITVPPLSLFFLAGMIYFPLSNNGGRIGFQKNFKKELYVFLPMLVFFVFHCFYPNKQERFILPFVPFFFIVGVLGWDKLKNQINIAGWVKSLESISWKLFWVLNTIVMLIFATSATKNPRVNSMKYLSEQADADYFLLENSHSDSYIMAPEFYYGKWDKFDRLKPNYTKESLNKLLIKANQKETPNYLVFFESEDLENRKSRFEQLTNTKFELVYIAEPSVLDQILYTLNPRFNKNEPAKIYKKVQ